MNRSSFNISVLSTLVEKPNFLKRTSLVGRACLTVWAYDWGNQSLFVLIPFLVVSYRVLACMASDANNCLAKLVGSFELVGSVCVHCALWPFNFGLNSDRFHEGINVVDPHSLSLIPHLRLRAFNHRKVNGPLLSISRVCVTGASSEVWPTSCKWSLLGTLRTAKELFGPQYLHLHRSSSVVRLVVSTILSHLGEKLSKISRQVPRLRILQYLDCILFLQPI